MLSGRGVALPSSSTRPAAPRRARRPPRGRRSGGPLVLVGGLVLLVDDDQPQLARRGRRRPSGDRRRPAPHPRAAAATRRSAGPCVRRECSTATVSPKRSLKRETICGVSAISGTITIAPAAPLQRLRGGAQVDLGLARGGHAVQQPLLEAPLGESPPAAARAPARCSPLSSRARPRYARRAVRRRTPCADRPPAPAQAAASAPGGSTSPSALASGRAVFRGQPPGEPHELLGHAQLERPQGRQQPLVRHLAALTQARDDAQDRARAERHDQHRADRDALAQRLRAGR